MLVGGLGLQESEGRPVGIGCAEGAAGHPKRELEYRIPRLQPPVNSWRFPEMFEYLCKNKPIFL